MKKIIFKLGALTLAFAAALPLAACGKEIIYVADKRAGQGGGGGGASPVNPSGTGTKTSTKTSEDPVVDEPGDYKLKVWCAEEDYEMVYTMLREYESKNPESTYTWTVEKQGEDVVSSTVLRDKSAAADVFSFANDQLGILLNDNALTQIPSRYEAQIDNQIDVAKIAASSSGSYYAIPYSYENCFLYYNKSKITDVGSMENILKASIPGVDYNLGIDMSDSYYTTMFLYTAGVSIFGENGNDPTSVDLDNEAAYKACRYIASLGSQKKLGSISKGDQYASLKNGKVAAMISGPHMISQFKDALGANFGVAMLPKVKFQGDSTETQLVSFSGVKMYGVTRKGTEVRDQKTTNEALKVAAYLANAENQMTRLTEREFCPTDSDLFEEALDSGIDTVKTVVEQSEYSKLKPGIIQMSNYWENMKGFLLGVYKLTYAESSWSTELKKIEKKLLGQ